LLAIPLLLLGCEKPSQDFSKLAPLFKNLKVPELGQDVSDFALADSTGHLFKLSDFRDNIVFLNFWATWCPPCIEEFPYMEAMNQRFKAKNFTMIAVSVDKSWADIENFFASQHRRPSFLVLHDKDHVVADGLGTVKFPETYVIGTSGKLLKKYVGPVNWLSSPVLDEWDGFFKNPK
jgi:peroxiredoxin